MIILENKKILCWDTKVLLLQIYTLFYDAIQSLQSNKDPSLLALVITLKLNYVAFLKILFFFHLSAIWLPHGQLWAAFIRATLFTQS